MGLQRKLLSGGGLLMGGQVLGQACSFLRNVIVARLLTPEDYGMAASLGIAMTLLEMVSNLAVDRLLVQAEDGDSPLFQATAHSFQVLRGIGGALILYLLAWPLTRIFGIPQSLWAFQCVALVPLIRGFAHLDPKRMQRSFGFGCDVTVELVPQLVLLLAAWPLVHWLQDYTAILWMLIIQSSIMVIMSHLVASRRYTLAWNSGLVRRMYGFGWPLLIDGLLMFAILQGERLAIGMFYDMRQLGIYSLAFSVAIFPSAMISRVISGLLLPLLSSAQKDSDRFVELYSLTMCALSIVCILVVSGFCFFGKSIVVLVFGENYAEVSSFLAWLSIAHMVRLLRVGVTIACISRGDSLSPLMCNTGRVAAFLGALCVAYGGASIVWIVVVGVAGEIFALAIGAGCLHRYHGVRYVRTLNPTGACVGGMVSAQVILLTQASDTMSTYSRFLGMLLMVGVTSIAILLSSQFSWRLYLDSRNRKSEI